MVTRTRKQNGSLRLKKREKGESYWQFRYYEPGPPRRRTAVMIGTKSQYPSKSAAFNSTTVQGLMLRINSENPIVGSDMKLGAVIGRYEKEEMPDRYSTAASYRSNLKVHIKPRWADVPLNAVKASAVETWLNDLKLAPKTKGHIRSLMHLLFECAERWELIDKNPIAIVRVKGGQRRTGRPQILSMNEFDKLVSLLSEPYKTMALIAGHLGLRSCEILALQWNDFTFKERVVLVQRGIVHGRVGDVKTESSEEELPFDERLEEVLRNHQNRCYQTAEGWLFANPKTGRPFHQDQIQKTYIKPAAESMGVADVGWHTFRHSFRSWLDLAGGSMGDQKDLMRHSNISTTMNVYGRAHLDRKRQVIADVARMFLENQAVKISVQPEA